MVGELELIATQLPLYILLAGLYYKQGKHEGKLQIISNCIETKMTFKKNARQR